MMDRKCELCGQRMERGRKRKPMPGGAKACPACAGGRPGGGNVQARLTEQGDLLIASTGARKLAHDSGDGATIYHCPFCGGGGVTGRSDGTAECAYCKSVFTVQVQPEFSSMPQTYPDTGDAVPMPGMPGERTEPGEVPTDDAPGAPGGDKTKFAFPEDITPDEANEHIQKVGQKGAPAAPPGKDGAPADAKDDGEKKNLPPWLKKKESKEAFDSTGYDPKDPTNQAALGDLADEDLDKDSGFTMDLHARTPRQGFMVGIPGHEEQHGHLTQVTPETISDYMERNMDTLEQPGMHLGGWVDHASGTVYLDISQRVDDENQARQLGQQYNQKAIWDLGGGKEVRLDQPAMDPTAVPPSTPQQQMAAAKHYFITDDGTALPTDAYIAHLATLHQVVAYELPSDFDERIDRLKRDHMIQPNMSYPSGYTRGVGEDVQQALRDREFGKTYEPSLQDAEMWLLKAELKAKLITFEEWQEKNAAIYGRLL